MNIHLFNMPPTQHIKNRCVLRWNDLIRKSLGDILHGMAAHCPSGKSAHRVQVHRVQSLDVSRFTELRLIAELNKKCPISPVWEIGDPLLQKHGRNLERWSKTSEISRYSKKANISAALRQQEILSCSNVNKVAHVSLFRLWGMSFT